MILVTGGAGFIGSNTVELLLNKGHKIRVFDNFSTGKKENLVSHKNLEIITGDVRDDDSLRRASKDVDAILHLAAQICVQYSIDNPKDSFANNLLGTINVLEVAKENNIKVVFASSAAVYGDSQDKMLNEKMADIDNILSPYAIDKLTSEKYLQLYNKLYGLNFVALRYFNVFGKNQDPNNQYSGVISKFVHNYQNNQNLVIFGDGKQSRDFINVKDVANANLLALKYNKIGVFNIATGQATTINDLANIVNNISDKKVEIDYQAAKKGDIKTSLADINSAANELGFKATRSIHDIKELV